MDDNLRQKLIDHRALMQARAAELATPDGNTDIAALMSGIALTLEALLVVAEESKTPRSGPTVEAADQVQ